MKCPITAKSLLASAWLLAVAPPLMAQLAPTAFIEDFNTNPAERAWKIFGDPTLFQWDPVGGQLAVTWDSSKPNSYFAWPLPISLTRTNDFMLALDLRLQDISIGTTPGKPFTFELAAGFLNAAAATATNFLRGTGFNSPQLVELDYFPDSGFGATLAPTIISSNGVFASSFNSPLELFPHRLYRVQLQFDSTQQTLFTSITEDGKPIGPLKPVVLNSEFTDFTVDYAAIMSYNDAGQDPQFSGSILAHGTVDNFFVAVSPNPTLDLGMTGRLDGTRWRVDFTGQAGWVYELHRTSRFDAWTPVATQTNSIFGPITLIDPSNPTGSAQFYRVVGHWLGRQP